MHTSTTIVIQEAWDDAREYALCRSDNMFGSINARSTREKRAHNYINKRNTTKKTTIQMYWFIPFLYAFGSSFHPGADLVHLKSEKLRHSGKWSAP